MTGASASFSLTRVLIYLPFLFFKPLFLVIQLF
jgi:hypothetical protein